MGVTSPPRASKLARSEVGPVANSHVAYRGAVEQPIERELKLPVLCEPSFPYIRPDHGML